MKQINYLMDQLCCQVENGNLGTIWNDYGAYYS